MYRWIRHAIVCLITASLIAMPVFGTAFAFDDEGNKEPTAAQMTADLLIVRPVGLISMLTGAGLFVLSLPFSFSRTNTQENYASNLSHNMDRLLKDPSQYTFGRRLGEFETGARPAF